MPLASANDIELFYDTFGTIGDDPLLLVMGHGAQMVDWEDDFCRRLDGQGFFGVRFDNRDVGLSTMLEAACPDPAAVLRSLASGEPAQAPYTIADMAADAAGLLDVLSIDSAHVLGASMGGMIAQELAIRHPARVRSVTLIMTSACPHERARDDTTLH